MDEICCRKGETFSAKGEYVAMQVRNMRECVTYATIQVTNVQLGLNAMQVINKR